MQEQSNIGISVKDFVNSFIEELDAVLINKGYKTCSEEKCHVKMELNAAATGESSGKVGAQILSIGASVNGTSSNTNSQKITVYIQKITELEIEEEKAARDIAKQKQRFATAIATKGIR